MKLGLTRLGLLLCVAGAWRAIGRWHGGPCRERQEVPRRHGNPPKTMTAKYPKIATFDAKFIEVRAEDSVKKVLIKGKGENMKPFKGKLTEDKIDAVTVYEREPGGKHGS